MIGAENLVDGFVFEHVEDGSENGGGHGRGRLLGARGGCGAAGIELGNSFLFCFWPSRLIEPWSS
jgi:hypothetical protein